MKRINSIFFALVVLLLTGSSVMAQKAKESLTEANLKAVMNEAYEKFKNAPGGANASYIPFLADVDSKLYGIAICTADGKLYEVGDAKYEFGIESISKVFVLALAMMDHGPKAIEDSIGVNATGMPFNSVLAVELEPARAVNPLVNAGAMATNSFVKAPNSAAKWQRIDDIFAKFAGRRLPVIDKLYQSESATNQHNKAIAYLLYSYGRFYDDVDVSVDLYTKGCSYGTSAKDLAVMAGTLANAGRNPITKEQVIKPEYCPKILANMITEGLYDSTGDWVYATGLPGKSGVGGGIIAVVPGKLAIAVFAPPLDKAGNSVKGQLAVKYMVDKLGLNLLDGRN